jgi:hypothetical protein
MLYNLCLQIHGPHLATALAAASVFVLIIMAKEKRDERKRA